MPEAIHCEPVSEETSRTRASRHNGLPRRPTVLLAMTSCTHCIHSSSPCHREGRKPVAIQFEPVSEPHPSEHLLPTPKGEVSFYRMAGFRACIIFTSFVLIQK